MAFGVSATDPSGGSLNGVSLGTVAPRCFGRAAFVGEPALLRDGFGCGTDGGLSRRLKTSRFHDAAGQNVARFTVSGEGGGPVLIVTGVPRSHE